METMVRGYQKNVNDIILKLYPDEDSEKIKEIIRNTIKSKVEDFEILTNNKCLSFLKVDRELANLNPIFSGYGTMFKQHKGTINMFSDLCLSIKNIRNTYKKNMFEHIHDLDQKEFKLNMMMQLNVKVLNNSIYGAAGESKSIFYHPFIGPSITYCGVDIITTSINAFERFLANNLVFYTMSDVINYLNIIYNDKEDKNITDFVYLLHPVSKEELKDYLLSKIKDSNYNDDDVFYLDKFLSVFNEDDYQKFYFKNNLFELLIRTDFSEVYLKHVVGYMDFTNPSNPPEEIKDYLEKIWDCLESVVFFNHQNYHRYKFSDKEKRKTVLTIDTDSCFLQLNDFYKYVKFIFPDKMGENKKLNIITTINILSYQIAKMIERVYDKYLIDLNIEDSEKRKFIAMKNEFTFERIMLTRNKKQYAGTIIAQEGNIFQDPKPEIKGLSIRKVNVNPKIREEFTDILVKDILEKEKIDVNHVFNSFKEMEQTIKNSLQRGEMTYALPAKTNGIEEYEKPYSIMPVRGTITWNILYPERELRFSSKVNNVKLIIPNIETVREALDPKKDRLLLSRFEECFRNKNLLKMGITVISLDKSIKNLPKELIQFIDIKTMINDNINNGLILLESLGMKTLPILTKKYPTNIVRI